MNEIFIPTLHTFAMKNTFTGSCGQLRFKITPNVVKVENSKEVDFNASSIDVEIWDGPYCYEKSQIKEKKTFPMSETGREAIRSYLSANA